LVPYLNLGGSLAVYDYSYDLKSFAPRGLISISNYQYFWTQAFRLGADGKLYFSSKNPVSNQYNIAKLSFEGNLAFYNLERHSLEIDLNLHFPAGTTQIGGTPTNLNFYT